MKIVVGSLNPTKIEATKMAFEAAWPTQKFDVQGIKVNSGVSGQPMSFEETVRGAKNRARTAMLQAPADYAVGLEGGLQKMSQGWFESGWCAVLNRSGDFGIGSTPAMTMPKHLMERIEAGGELGHVLDQITGRTGVGKEEGFFGIMTGGAISRTEALKEGIIFALSRFIRPDFFTQQISTPAVARKS